MVTSRVVVVIAVLVAAVSCSSTPTGPSGADQFTWTADGQSFQANDMGALRAPGGGGTITGANCSSGAILNITFFTPFNFSAGTFPVSSQYWVTWTPDARTGQAAGTNWEAGGTRGSGTLTVTTVDSSRISGSFSFQMPPGVGSPGTGTKTVEGNFNVSFAENRIC